MFWIVIFDIVMASAIDTQIIKDKIRGLVKEEDNINDVTVRHIIDGLEKALQINIKDHPELTSLVVDETTKFIEDEWKPHLKELVTKKCTEVCLYVTFVSHRSVRSISFWET